MNLNYYKFGSNSDTTEFTANINVEVEAIHSMIQGQHLALRCCTHKWSMPTVSPRTGSNRWEFGPPTSNHPRHCRKGEKNPPSWHQKKYKMTIMSKRPLKTESAMVSCFGVHPTGGQPDNTLYACPLRHHVQFHIVPTRSKVGPCTRDEVLVPSNSSARPSSWLPHPPSIKLPWSREVWFNKVVTKILGLSDPIKARHAVSTILNLVTEAKMP
jgi:hypothetical protein